MEETPEAIKEQFAVVEMMGHRKIAGAIKQSELAPGALIRVDVFGSTGEIERTEHVGSSAIYDITICSEQTAKAAAIAHNPQPSFAYDILRERPERQLPGFGNDYEDGDEGRY
jgi:hypothetical protein